MQGDKQARCYDILYTLKDHKGRKHRTSKLIPNSAHGRLSLCCRARPSETRGGYAAVSAPHPNFTLLRLLPSPCAVEDRPVSFSCDVNLIESFRLATNPRSLGFEYFVNVIQYDFTARASI